MPPLAGAVWWIWRFTPASCRSIRVVSPGVNWPEAIPWATPSCWFPALVDGLSNRRQRPRKRPPRSGSSSSSCSSTLLDMEHGGGSRVAVNSARRTLAASDGRRATGKSYHKESPCGWNSGGSISMSLLVAAGRRVRVLSWLPGLGPSRGGLPRDGERHTIAPLGMGSVGSGGGCRRLFLPGVALEPPASAVCRPGILAFRAGDLRGLFSNEVLPLRPGELIRSYLQAHWCEVPFSVAFASAIIERLLDGASG